MKVNIAIIAIVIVAILGLVYFLIAKNRKDQKDLEQDLNERELSNKKGNEPRI